MRLLILALSLMAVFLLQWMLGTLPLPAMPPPLIWGVTLLWFWTLSLPRRLALAFVVGFLLDTIAPQASGTNLILLLLAALGTEFLRRLLSEPSSPRTRGVAIGILLTLAALGVQPLSYLLARLEHIPPVPIFPAGSALAGALAWAFVFAVIVTAMSRLRRNP